jgi:hypothetical protein
MQALGAEGATRTGLVESAEKRLQKTCMDQTLTALSAPLTSRLHFRSFLDHHIICIITFYSHTYVHT